MSSPHSYGAAESSSSTTPHLRTSSRHQQRRPSVTSSSPLSTTSPMLAPHHHQQHRSPFRDRRDSSSSQASWRRAAVGNAEEMTLGSASVSLATSRAQQQVERQRTEDMQQQQQAALLEEEEQAEGEEGQAPVPTEVAGGGGNPKYSHTQLFVTLAARIIEPISFTILFPFVNPMIESLLPSVPPSSIGAYSGALESLFSISSFLCMYQWGKLSDRVGRKPVVVNGLVGVGATLIMFGLSRSYWMAVIARALSGALCGNASVLRASLGEISSPETEGWMYPLWSICWDLSVILGPAMGALLADPAKQYPSIRFFQSSFFKTYPFFLPCGVAAGLAFAASLMVLVCFNETLDKKVAPRTSSSSQQDETQPLLATEPEAKDDDEQTMTALQLIAIPAVRHILISSFLICFIALSFDAVLVLFCYSAVPLGGIALTPAGIALCLTLRGTMSITFSLLFFPLAQKRFGTQPLYRFFVACWLPAFILPPIMNAIVRGDTHGAWVDAGHLKFMWVLMAPLMVFYTLGDLSFPLNMLAVNAASPNASCLGALNGIALSVGSLARSMGPAFIGFAYSISAKTGFPWVWLIYVAICLLAAIQAWWVKGRQEQEQDRA